MKYNGKKCLPEKGGGKCYVEKRASRSINDMYARLLATGELQNAIAVKADNSHGSKERATALMANAKVAPNYLTNEDIRQTKETVGKVLVKSRANKAKYTKQSEIKMEVDKILKQEGINR